MNGQGKWKQTLIRVLIREVGIAASRRLTTEANTEDLSPVSTITKVFMLSSLSSEEREEIWTSLSKIVEKYQKEEESSEKQGSPEEIGMANIMTVPIEANLIA